MAELDWFFEAEAGSANLGGKGLAAEESRPASPTAALVHCASQGKHGELIELLGEGADAAKRLHGRNALHVAAVKGQVAVLAALHEGVRFRDGPEAAAALLASSTTPDGRTALQLACLEGILPVVRWLLKQEAVALGPEDTAGFLAPHHAAFAGHVDVLDALEARFGVDTVWSCESRESLTPAMVAAAEGQTPVLAHLQSGHTGAGFLRGESELGFTVLHKAAQSGDASAVAFALEHEGGVVDAANVTGTRALHLAATHGHGAVARLLIDKGADVNAATDARTTPAQIAAYQGHTEVLDALRASGADLRQVDGLGNTVLHHAAAGGSHQVVDALLKDGGTSLDTLMSENADGQSAAVLASVNGYKRLAHHITRRTYIAARVRGCVQELDER